MRTDGSDGTSGGELTPVRPTVSLRGLFPSQMDRILELARTHLEMDLAFVSAFTGGRQIHQQVAGDASSFGMRVGDGPALEDTYCQLLVDGTIACAIPDTADEPAVADLAATHEAGIGAYIGIPLHLSDGSLYGSFCCISHTAQEGLDDRAVRFLSMLGALVADEVQARHQRETDRRRMQQLIDDRDLMIALQPIVSLSNRRCQGFESLSRFPYGWGPPNMVFAKSCDIGMDVELERLAVARACEMLPRLGEAQYLTINMSRAAAIRLTDLLDTDYTPVLDRLVVEVTESAIVENYDVLRRRLRPLRDRGLRLAIDDLGAGFSSLQHLVELEPDIIKIDRALTSGLAADHTRQRVCAAFTALAADLGATVIAEGVETLADLHAAEDLHVHAVQGYVFARPTTDPLLHQAWADGQLFHPEDARAA